ncbi:glycogen debranching protein GlgX [Streptomyces sp. NBC_01304]|uniref:glycogen debranching protein GlgX n=1 Tax=Streptomyces sp. NBC_01304 TaxID=2903818 RepID=UPI002E157DBD|nr:glycogen debranching protein GlgX [Streptomyces sp. NBC_01304]
METWAGRSYPLGAMYDGTGTNFALFSEVAEKVELCLIDDDGAEQRIRVREVDGLVWHVHLPGIRPGQRYGYRVHGPYAPELGHRCSPAKLLLDPYARAIDGEPDDHASLFDGGPGSEAGPNPEDSLGHTFVSVVTDTVFDWENDRPPDHPYHDTVIYEAHVRGLTRAHPGLPPELRGTYAALGHPVMLEHLSELGVTAIELMPVHQFLQDGHLREKGLSNYWGYNTIGFFAPHHAYASGGSRGEQVTEFKSMVKSLHRAGIEVLLDVVYNHTAEGNERGPTLSFRGIDNAAYYRLVDDDPAHYFDTTGTGNSLLMRHPHVLQLIMDSLRYWVQEMHVDGFRFDLAATLARQFHEVDRLSAFFDLVQQDPVVSRVKLIAEPWDIGDGGYHVGNFPSQWSEWNGEFRDTVRDFWRGQDATLADFATRLAGSSDLYEADRRRPRASINFVTAHDGFTLRDLVSYNQKHNEANGEDGNDGSDDNRSWNCGAEGDTDDATVLELRARQQRNLLTTLLCSQGIPMIAHGDELGRTQQGNNNVYCQDNELSWVDWDLDAPRQDLLAFVRRLVRLRHDHPVLRRRRHFRGETDNDHIDDLVWLRPDGTVMQGDDWDRDDARAIAAFLHGGALPPGPRGERVIDDSLLILVNSHHEAIDFQLPMADYGKTWHTVLSTAETRDGRARTDGTDGTARTVRRGESEGNSTLDAGTVIPVEGRSIRILSCPAPGQDFADPGPGLSGTAQTS